MLTESRAQTTIRYTAEASIVAGACQRTLASLGKVTHVSRQTGTIAGQFKNDLLSGPVFITLTITRKDAETELSIATQRKEGLATSGGAQKGLQKFLSALTLDPELRGKGGSGW